MDRSFQACASSYFKIAMHDRSAFETPSLPALTRSYPCRFTFYVAHPIRSIQFSAFSRPQFYQQSTLNLSTFFFRYDPRATLLYGTRKNFPVYGSLTTVPGANALTST